MGDCLILDGRSGSHEDFAGGGRETVGKLGMLAFHITQSSGVGNFPGAGERLAVMADKFQCS